jgi:hypothetical protein
MSNQIVPYNDQGIVQSLIRNRALQLGYELTPVIISDTAVHAAPTGTYFYQFRCLGATDAVIDEIIDTQAAAVAGFAGVTITAADVPYNYLCTSIQLTSGAVIAYLKNIPDL